METLFHFMVRASVFLMVFALGYYFLRTAVPRVGRFYILLSFILSLGLAGIGKIQIPIDIASADPGATLLLPEFILEAQDGIAAAGSMAWSQFSFTGMFLLIPALMVAFLLGRLLLRLKRIFSEIQKHPGEHHENVKLVYIEPERSPFSFFRWIFIPESLKQSSHFEKVLLHEKAHYYQLHSWDVMFMEVMRLLFWFHPAWYYLKKALLATHEYEADNFVLTKFPRVEYQQALLDCALDIHYLPVTNPFNVSMIKKRFIMMNQNLKPDMKKMWIRLLWILPVLAFVFALQSFELQSGLLPVVAEAVNNENSISPPPDKEEDEKVFTVVEESPTFRGGQQAMMNFLQENLTYPPTAREEKIQGTVFVTFVVEKDGSITGVKILRGVQPDIDAEAMRVVKAMPAWTPGYQDDEPVRVQFNLPIRFVL